MALHSNSIAHVMSLVPSHLLERLPTERISQAGMGGRGASQAGEGDPDRSFYIADCAAREFSGLWFTVGLNSIEALSGLKSRAD
jgi:hypothetical protein